jgi:hypothetical protein
MKIDVYRHRYHTLFGLVEALIKSEKTTGRRADPGHICPVDRRAAVRGKGTFNAREVSEQHEYVRHVHPVSHLLCVLFLPILCCVRGMELKTQTGKLSQVGKLRSEPCPETRSD